LLRYLSLKVKQNTVAVQKDSFCFEADRDNKRTIEASDMNYLRIQIIDIPTSYMWNIVTNY
jgi:hypothetical protein